MEKYTIKEHLAKKWAKEVALDIVNLNNDQTLYESESLEFIELFKKEFLFQMGYDIENED